MFYYIDSFESENKTEESNRVIVHSKETQRCVKEINQDELEYNEHVKPAEEIGQWWIDRWAVQRFANLVKKNKVQKSHM
jgi:hypothetical protein